MAGKIAGTAPQNGHYGAGPCKMQHIGAKLAPTVLLALTSDAADALLDAAVESPIMKVGRQSMKVAL